MVKDRLLEVCWVLMYQGATGVQFLMFWPFKAEGFHRRWISKGHLEKSYIEMQPQD